jgi:hypothetical protein
MSIIKFKKHNFITFEGLVKKFREDLVVTIAEDQSMSDSLEHA